MEQNYRLTIAYDGSRFFGWERQPDKDTIQGKLEAVLGTLQGHPVNVIGAGQDGPADHLVNDTADRVDAYTATKGRVESMMSLVSTCIDEKKNISFIVAMQNAAVVIGFVLVAFLTFVAGVEQISAFALVIYELFWVLATVLVPKFRNKVK